MVLIKNPFFIGVDYETATHMEGNLATEASMLVLDTLDLIVQIVSHTDHSQGLLASVLRFVYIVISTFCLHPPGRYGLVRTYCCLDTILIYWLFTFSEYSCMPWEPISLPCFYNTFLQFNDRLFSNFPVFYLTKPQSIVPICVYDCSNIVPLRYLQFVANPLLPCICWWGRILKLEM